MQKKYKWKSKTMLGIRSTFTGQRDQTLSLSSLYSVVKFSKCCHCIRVFFFLFKTLIKPIPLAPNTFTSPLQLVAEQVYWYTISKTLKVWTDCLARHKWCAKSLKHQLWKYRLLQWLHAESQMLCLCYYVEQPSGQPQGQQSCPSTLFACWITPKASSGENLLIFLDSNGNLQCTLSIDANICMQPSAILFAISVTSSREKRK